MADLANTIQLTRVRDGTSIKATLVPLTRTLAAAQIDARWWTGLGISKSVREKENDYSWRWAKRLGQLKNDRWQEAVAVQTEDGELHGAALYWLNGKSFVHEDQGAVHLEALATAPRNRFWLVSEPAYRGVGDALLLHAVAQSYTFGLRGVVNLEAFDEPRLLDFYQKRGFEIIRVEEGATLLELPTSQAEAWLQREGLL